MLARPRATLVVVALVTGLLLPAALRVRVDSAVDRLLPAHDPARAHLEATRATFGSDELVVVALFADDVLSPPTLERVAELTTAIERLDDVREVVSLSTLEVVRDGPDGLGQEPLLHPPPWTASDLEALRAAVETHPLAHAGIVAPDGRAAGIVVELQPLTDEALLAGDLVGRLQAVVAAHPGPEPVAITGLPVLKVRAAEAMVRDVTRFFLLGVLVVGAVLWLAFRSVRDTLLPLATVLAGLAWTTAFMTLAGDAYTLGTLVLSPLLLSVGIAYAIHTVSRVEDVGATGRPRRDVVREAVRQVRLPLVMAALTTLAGFASFLINPIPTIRDFGWYAGVGLACVLAANLTILPCALALIPGGPGRPRDGRPGWIDRLTAACSALALRRGRAVLLIGVLTLPVTVAGIARVRVETDYLRFFAPSHPARADNARIAEGLVGTQIVVVTLAGPGPEAMTRVAASAALADLVAFLRAQPEVDQVVSYLDHLALLRQGFEPRTAAEPLRDQAALDQRMVLLNPERTRRVLAADGSRAQVIAYTRLSGSSAVAALEDRVEAWAAHALPPGIEVRTTGTLVLLTHSADVLARQQVVGLAQVLAVLAVLLIALFRSIRLGLLSLVPNLYPVLMLLGIMGWTDIELDVSTSMIACIAIGIAVDDTIHYLTAYRAAARTAPAPATAVAATIRTVGRPIVLTSVALAAGFLVPCLSSFQPVRHFGMLASVTMVLALFADLLLLPALLVRLGSAVGER